MVCIQTCIHMQAYIITYIDGQKAKQNNITHIMSTYTHTYIHTGREACIHTYKHTSIHTGRHKYIHTYSQRGTHTYIHTYMHTYIHRDRTHTHKYRHAYRHTYILPN